MKALFRILGTAAAVAATGAAIVVLDKILNDKAPLHVEKVEFPEQAEQDAAEAEKTAQAYAQAQEMAEEAPVAETPAPAASAAAAPVHQPQTIPAAPADSARPAYDPEAPNVNPVEAGPAVAPRDENGNFDPTKIADPNDFGDWEEQGCQG